MSGFEIAGLVLGAFSLLHQLTGVGEGSAGIFEHTSAIQKSNSRIRKKLMLQKNALCYELRRLFSGTVDESKIEMLFQDAECELWADEQWNKAIRERLGTSYTCANAALENVLDALQDLERSLKKISGTDDVGALVESKKNLRNTMPPGDILSKDRLSLRVKRKAALKDPKIKKKLKELKESNIEFQQFVNRVLATTPSETSTVATLSGLSSEQSLKSIQRMQRVSKRLYELMSRSRGFPCPCHGFNLALEFDAASGARDLDTPQQRCFRLLAMMRPSAGASFEMMMDIDGLSSMSQEKSGLQLVEIRARKVVLPKAPKPILKKPLKTEAQSNTKSTAAGKDIDTSAVSDKMCGKRSRPGLSFQLSRSIQKLTNGKKQNREDPDYEDENGVESVPTIQLTEIDDLCKCLLKVNQCDSKPAEHNEECMGFLPDKNDGTQYLFYSLEWPLHGPKSSNQSLLDMLRSQAETETFKVPARLELAFILSVLLLQHESSPWIKKKFHSKDLDLYSGFSSKTSALRWIPHIAVTFDSINQTFAQQNPESHEETRVFSLGVILIEIGRAKPMWSDSEQAEVDEDKEYTEAWRHVHRKTTATDMGPVYQNVVKTCVTWDKDAYLSEETAQVKFYDEVVCKLDRALWAINGTSRLGNAWGSTATAA